MDTKTENLRPWARRCPRLALATVYALCPVIWLLCHWYTFLEALRGFKEAWCEDFSDVYLTMKRWTAETKEILRREIVSRKKE